MHATVVTYLVPVFGIAWGALFLGESVTLAMLGGAGVVIAGVVLVTRPAARASR
jgi:drug/metabolite transporter (DMT)-like permease